ncbi:MAG: heme exporter protein CcmB [Gammaproteobacteria bacterium]|nr:heme exporter protein CcmB [Gammaproteobacteria bacterium]
MKKYLKREWLLSTRQFHHLLQPIFFILILVVLFPLAIGIEAELLKQIASGIIWIAVLLSMLLASEKFYKEDFEDGSLEQLYLSGRSLLLLIMAKALVQWFVLILPLMLAIPLFGVFYDLSWRTELQLAITLLLGSPSLLLLSMLGSVVILSVSRGSLLLILLILPLTIPTLIFALSAISAYSSGFSHTGQLSILGAILAITVVTIPFAIATIIKVSVADAA